MYKNNMLLYFKEKSNIQLEIPVFYVNIPIYIKHNNLFLRCHEIENVVDFYHSDDNTGRQKWILERDIEDSDIFYIKTSFSRFDSAAYLGCPNEDTVVYLYTTKNRFTKWNIIDVENGKYIFSYVGEKLTPDNHTIVVSRYNEDISWLLPYKDSVIVYNKGPTEVSDFNNVVTIRNKGREGDTYLYHMIKHYKNHAKRTTFLQGESLPHNNTLLFALDNYEKLEDFQPLGFRWLEEKQVPPTEILHKYKTVTDFGLQYLVIQINNNLDYLDEYYFFDIGLITTKNRYFRDYGCVEIIDDFLKRCKYPGTKSTEKVNYTWSALFSLKSEKIDSYEKAFYERVIKELTITDEQGGADGYVLEKLWVFLFE